MARSSGSKKSSSSSSSSSGKKTTSKEREDAGKGAIKEEFLRKKDELFKLKSLDVFLMTNAMGINPKKSDMKPELKAIVKRLKAKNLKTV
jgi:hypothetical protein